MPSAKSHPLLFLSLSLALDFCGCLDLCLLDDIPLGVYTRIFILFSQSRKAVCQYQCKLFGGILDTSVRQYPGVFVSTPLSIDQDVADVVD